MASGVEQSAALLPERSLLQGGYASSTMALPAPDLLELENVKLLIKNRLRARLPRAMESSCLEMFKTTCGCGT